ncbi:DsbE family thiol:disulfide interchange protein [Magnetovirga frankeli]|uniref:DsbE family thiol:disulfide interchange protein n=1 Tax=Magnetovirga frankeli TaxID=947516 RepID=UPI00129358FD|nr:DsbE family thiol:disulfide interchange protein [gamma proteobacterium SS-5]
MKLKAALPLILFFALAVLFYFMLGKINQGEYNPRDIPTEFIGRSAPEFSLPDLLKPEQSVRPSDFKGKPWLFNVWGTWCPECWREHEFLVLLHKQGVPIVGLNWRDEAPEAKKMLARLGNPFVAIGFDPTSDVAIDWGVYGAPETFLIDAEGIIRVKHKGAMTPQIWQEQFQSYFNLEAKP